MIKYLVNPENENGTTTCNQKQDCEMLTVKDFLQQFFIDDNNNNVLQAEWEKSDDQVQVQCNDTKLSLKLHHYGDVSRFLQPLAESMCFCSKSC
ncbi:hypothetical protein FGO68_gene9167 [Halteria grandinella]|uniref:Uncharacterized protein n=1 Tax=Halteria grandinella TaxID=5974 RepID=A0A8J8NNW1_HALGN|nr:hypothetical protein FGO68_gene9167 [Halteria grandinella]